MKSSLAVLVAAFLLMASASAQNPDSVNWVPQEYTTLVQHKDYEDWGGLYYINGNLREGFVGDFCEDEPVFGANAAGGGEYDITVTYGLERPIYAYMFQISVWMLDSWENETVKGEMNGEEIFSLTKDHTTNVHEHCGRGEFNEHSEDYFFKKDLSASELSFRMSSNANEDPFNESMGISNVKVWVAYCDYGCKTCDGQGVDSCLECINGFDFNHGACIPDDMALIHSLNTEHEYTTTGTWTIGGDQYMTGDEFPGATCDGDLTFGIQHANKDYPMVGTFNVPSSATACAVQFDLWMIDTIGADAITVVFEDENIGKFKYMSARENEHNTNACGDGEDDKIITILTPTMLVNGTGIMTLSLSSSIHQSDAKESFGVSKVKFFCELCHPTCNTCSHPSDPNGCTSCNEDDLLHVPRESQIGSCRQPTTECLEGYVALGDKCFQGCDPESNEGREGIQWLYGLEPSVSVTPQEHHLDVDFSSEIPDICFHPSIDIQAHWVLNQEPVGSFLHSPNLESASHWDYKVYLLESQLNDHDICEELTPHDAPVLKYSCSVYFNGSYDGDATTFWVATVLVDVEDGVFINSSVSILTHPHAETR
mmetsp:Transcript_23447/g.26605  ORF Transcript_23447/g.26605 Transcript_23447/m.26605 type:complete len:596 (-) Transcript_23447:137-1924(-)